MEALAVIGLVANIVQFVDFGIRIVSKGNEIYRSGEGLSAKNHDLEVVTNDLLLIQSRLGSSLRSGGFSGPLTKDDQALANLTIVSHELAITLLERLNKAKAQGRYRLWKSLRQALKSVCSRRDIGELAQRLLLLRDQLNTRTLISLQEKADTAIIQQRQIQKTLDNTSSDILNALRSGTELVRRSPVTHVNSLACHQHQPESAVGCTVGETIDSIDLNKRRSGNLKKHGEGSPSRPDVYAQIFFEILESLTDPSIDMREEAISDAHLQTFKWICEDSNARPWDNFVTWLRDDSGIYWVNGKAGSGKSTLMKYLSTDSRVDKTLSIWSEGLGLLRASHFFYSAGTPIQRSQAGLLRSLLYKCLSKNHALIPIAMPDLWNELTASEKFHLPTSWSLWSLKRLQVAFQKLVAQDTIPVKLCFFINGLDEFEGNHDEIVDLFRQISNPRNNKICLSSRPMLVFEQGFKSCSNLRLQDLTKPDITLFVQDRLTSHKRSNELSHEEPELVAQLTREIVQKSSGVFLWVSLVIKSLLIGITNYDKISDLRRRLQELPPELDDLYTYMLNNIRPPFYIEQASRLFQMVHLSRNPISTLALSFADDEDNIASFDASIEQLGFDERYTRVRAMTRRLKSRTAGLLEVKEGIPQFHGEDIEKLSMVTYLHLSVKEFLEKPEVWTKLVNKTSGTGFDPNVSLLKAVLVQLNPRNFLENQQICTNAIQVTNRVIQTIDLVENAMAFALQAENGTGIPQVLLLDELDRRTREIFIRKSMELYHPRVKSPRVTHWCVLAYHFYELHDSFTTFAISRGLVKYVQAKLSNNLGTFNQQSTLTLLEYATTYRPASPLESTSEHPETTFVLPDTQLPIVAWLLQNGLNPNESRNGSSPWQQVLKKLARAVDQDIALEATWLAVCKLYAIYGADPNACVISTNGMGSERKLSVAELITEAFAHLPQESIREVRAKLCKRRPQQDSKKTFRRKRRRAGK